LSRDNPEENFKRFPALLRPSQLEEIDRYRQDIGTLPNKAEAIRDIIDLGLETYWANKKKLSEGRED
jgi:hypothetical protein